MIFGSICSGIEAASLAWIPLGWRCAFVAEIDPFACAVLKYHYPEVPNLGDFTQIGARSDIDVLVGGTPCQSFSVAGLRGGMADDRGNLALEFLRLVARIRPSWVLWENVPGVLSSNGGRDFGAFLGGLGQLGYGWAYRVLDAQHVRTCGFPVAVPQQRRRVFVVGCSGDFRRLAVAPSRFNLGQLQQLSAAVLFNAESLSRHPPARRQAGQDVAGSLAARAGAGGGLGTDFDCHGGLRVENGTIAERDIRGLSGADGLASASATITTQYGEQCGRDYENDGTLVVAHSLRADGFDASEDGTGRGTPLVAYQCQGTNVGPIGTLRQGNGGVTGGVPFVVGEVVSCTLPASGGGVSSGMHPVVPVLAAGAHNSNSAGVGRSGDPSFTLDSTGSMAIAFNPQAAGSKAMLGISEHRVTALGTTQTPAVAFQERGRADGRNLETSEEVSYALKAPDGGGAGDWFRIQAGPHVRRLTPIECERLMGFPDNYTLVPYRGKLAANGPRYRGIGNSMAVNVIRWIGQRIAWVEQQLQESPS